MTTTTRTLSAGIEALLTQYAGRVQRAAARYGIDAADVDQVMQETRLRLWRHLEQGMSADDIGPSLIYRIAAGASMDLLRRRDARREEPESAAADTPVRDSSALDRVALRDALQHCLFALLDARRAVVSMYLCGSPPEEIRTLLRWTEAKARNLLYRGLSDLRGCLRQAGFEGAQ
jgi:RNA polymerase sigma factor (sigma-70 family)